MHTNSPMQYLLEAVNWVATILEPPTNQAPRTFTTSLQVTKAEGLPKEIAGQEVALAFQAPDRLKIRVTWEKEDLVLCRDGQAMWIYAAAERFGMLGGGKRASAAAAQAAKGEAPLGPLRLPIPAAQLKLLPLFADAKILPGEAVGSASCRVLEVTAKLEAVETLKAPRGVLRLWLRESDSVPLKVGYHDGKGAEVQIALANPEKQPAWPDERWQLKADKGDRIMTAANYFDSYDPGAPLKVTIKETTEVNSGTPEEGYSITRFTFDAYQGEKIPSLISLPLNRWGKRLPVILFLHGIGQNKNFLKEITAPFNRAGFAFTSFDQYTQGERKLGAKKSVLADLGAFVERPAKTLNETRRLIDYLAARPDIDPQRIYLVGASYGAVVGSIVLAKDRRVRAGVMVYGGGDFNKLLDSAANRLGVAAALGLIDSRSINPEMPPLPQLTSSQERQVTMVLGLIKPLASYFLGAADPIHYAGLIAPTPVYFQNGTKDVLVPAAAGKALQDAASEPKKIKWYESDHVGIDREQTVQVLEDGLKWLLEQDAPFRKTDWKSQGRYRP